MANAGRIPWLWLLLGGVVGLAVAAMLLVLVGPLAFTAFNGGSSYRIRDSAMAPVLLPGDWVLAEALTPGETPERGALVAYLVPGQRGAEQIRRVVGLPGETVQIRGGAVYINGYRALMERLEDRVLPNRREGRGLPPAMCINDERSRTGPCIQEVWRETLPGGRSVRVLNTRNRIGHSVPGRNVSDDTSVMRIPNGQVFLLGDNRDSALDSRNTGHGPVPISRLRYQVSLIHTSLDRTARFITPRWNRFFREVE
ncbi:MAG: signal peptidase I [Paracoccaceae bacterium]|nr:signal peptidase I [Paracoccaceae bacterium]